MASTGLRGPFSLTDNGIKNEVLRTSPGAYALGDEKDSTFYVKYIGRSDSDVNDRLHDHVGGSYSKFKYEYYSSSKAAFEKECHLYHDFSPDANKVHPARPSGSSFKCPDCKVFG
jgi:hypothetical protein